MISSAYILKNILFLGPLISGGIIAINSKDEVLKYITLLYTCAFGAFLLYTLYYLLNTSDKRKKLLSNYLRFYGDPNLPVSQQSDNKIFLSLLFMPGVLVDKFLFPSNIYLYYTMLIIFSAGAVASTYYAIELNNEKLIWLLAIPISIIIIGIFYMSDKAFF